MKRELNRDMFAFVHVDDMFIFDSTQSSLKSFIAGLERDLSHTGMLKVQQGDTIEYLSLLFTFINTSMVINMRNYVRKLLQDLNVREVANTPAKDDLFEPREEERASLYSAVYRLLYLAKRGRPDILVPVSYLTSRVSEPNKSDVDKLWRVLRYPNYTKDDMLRLELNGDGSRVKIRQSIDALYAKIQTSRASHGHG